MLDETTFRNPKPMIAVSEEFFADQKQIRGFDWVIVDLMRKEVQPFGCFRFVYVTSQQDNVAYDTLIQLGMHFASSMRVTIGSIASETAYRELLASVEFVIAPSLSNALKTPMSKEVTADSRSVATGLASFIRSGSPYTLQTFLSNHIYG